MLAILASMTAGLVSPTGPLTRRVLESLPRAAAQFEVGGAGGKTTEDGLLAADAALQQLFHKKWPPAEPAEFVRQIAGVRPCVVPGEASINADVAVCGGTLGILVATSLQLRGHQVVVIEAGPLQGRAQDWNASEEELQRLVDAGVLTEAELRRVAPLTFGPMSCTCAADQTRSWVRRRALHPAHGVRRPRPGACRSLRPIPAV